MRPLANNLSLEAIAKPQSAQKCHSERSEESRIFSDLRSFTSFLRYSIFTTGEHFPYLDISLTFGPQAKAPMNEVDIAIDSLVAI
jgi:hypothetical protein